jgi:RNA polymerase sigma-70 factor (ECF subfamily)
VITQTVLKAVEGSADFAESARQDFESILRNHQAMVFSVAYNFLRNRAVAEDLAQDVFLSLYQSLSTIKSQEHLVFWLRKVTIHRCLDHARRQKSRNHANIDDVQEPSVAASEPDVLLSQRLKYCVDGLPEKARMVVVLRYQEEMEPAEIAAVMAMPVNTVKSHLRRSLATLREKLGAVLGNNFDE